MSDETLKKLIHSENRTVREMARELLAARKKLEAAAKHIHWCCTQKRMDDLHEALKRGV